MAELIIAKCRMGAIGKVRATWIGEYTAFENYIGTYVTRELTPPKSCRRQFTDAQ